MVEYKHFILGACHMENWAQNVVVPPAARARPNSLHELLGTVREANATNREVRAYGSAWSFTDCWATPDVLIDTSALDRVLGLSEGQSVWRHRYPNRAGSGVERSAVLVRGLDDAVIAAGRRLVHVEAGIKLHRLIEVLDHPQARGNYAGHDIGSWSGQPTRGRWSLTTMGGSTGQSLAGVLATATHGGDFDLPPIADMVRALHIVTADGSAHWIEPAGERRITARAKLLDQDREVLAQGGLVAEQIHYDDDLFDAALVSVGRLGIVYAAVIEVREQFGLSERVRPGMSWRGLRPLLQSGALFTGTQGLNWLDDHPTTLASDGRRIERRPRGVELFINPYRASDDYVSDPDPDRQVLLITKAEAVGGFDDALHLRPAGPGDLEVGKLVMDFELASSLGVVRRVIDRVMAGLRPVAGTRGYPIAHSVLAGTGESQPILSMEIAVSTRGGRHVDLIDALLAVVDRHLAEYWTSGHGQRAKFAGGIALRYTQPTAALLGLQRGDGTRAPERFCHIEIILMKEVRLLPPPQVHAGHHNMESLTERWVRDFERVAIDMGARLHWGQLQRLNRRQVERGYPDTLHRWRHAATRFLTRGRAGTLGNWFTRRTGLEPNQEVLAATSWGPNRYDVFGYDERGDVLQLAWEPGWQWRRHSNRFPGGERFCGPLVATSWGHGRIDVFGLGRRGTVLHLWWENGWRWADLAVALPAVFGGDRGLLGPLAAVAPAPGRIELFALAARGVVWRFWYDGQRWQVSGLGNGFRVGERFQGAITAVSWGPERVDVFGFGSRGQVLQLWRDGGEAGTWRWGDLSPHFPPERFRFAGPLTGVATGGQRIDLVAKDELGNPFLLFWGPAPTTAPPGTQGEDRIAERPYPSPGGTERGDAREELLRLPTERPRAGPTWVAQGIANPFGGGTRKGGFPEEFGQRPSIDDTYLYRVLPCAPRQFLGPITMVSWGGRRLDVFGFGDDGRVLQLWRAADESPWRGHAFANGWRLSPDQPVTAVVFDVQIGDDGLDRDHVLHRPPSRAIGVVRLANGHELRQDLNQGAEWQAHSRRVVTMMLPPQTRHRDLAAAGLVSQTSGHDLGADNWDVANLTITFQGPEGADTLVQGCGAPLVRFTRDRREWVVPVIR
jgi:hypothetical protein